METIIHGNTFSRVLANDSKKGAYYTDTEMCRRIGKLLSFPQGEEVTVLEPSIGDGTAVRAVLENKGNCKTPLFAVELDRGAASELRGRMEEGDVLLNADFIRGVSVTPGTFGYCFANPPYGTDDFLKRRYEQIFLEKIYAYLRKDGIVTLVVPYYLFTREEEFVRTLMNRFELLKIYRFDDRVYQQFQQVCVLLRRRPKMIYSFGKNAYTEWLSAFPAAESLPYLPENPTDEEIVSVPVAKHEEIKMFATISFDVAQAGKTILRDSLNNIIGEHLFGPAYTANELTRPPIPPKKDILYLCAIAGAGQGLCGSEEDGDLHLQRGVVRNVVSREIRRNEEGGKAVMVETSRAAVTMTTLESDGTIRHLM